MEFGKQQDTTSFSGNLPCLVTLFCLLVAGMFICCCICISYRLCYLSGKTKFLLLLQNLCASNQMLRLTRAKSIQFVVYDPFLSGRGYFSLCCQQPASPDVVLRYPVDGYAQWAHITGVFASFQAGGVKRSAMRSVHIDCTVPAYRRRSCIHVQNK